MATAGKAALVAALVAAVALLALRQSPPNGKAAVKAAPGYDLADGRGRMLTGRRLRVNYRDNEAFFLSWKVLTMGFL